MEVTKNNYKALEERKLYIADLLNTAHEVVWGLNELYVELEVALDEYDRQQRKKSDG